MDILLMFTEKSGFKLIRCLVHENRMRSFIIIEGHVCFDVLEKVLFCFEAITV